MKSKSHRINVLGREINVLTTTDAETVLEIERFVNSRLAEFGSAGKIIDRELLVILTLMNIAEEYLSLEKNMKKNGLLENDRILRLMRLLESAG